MLGLGLSLIKGAGKNVGAFLSYIKDSLKLYYRFYDNSPELLLSGATSFDGSDDYINCGNDSSLDITDAITVSAWMLTTVSSDHQRIVAKQFETDNGTANSCFQLAISNSDKFRWAVGGVFDINSSDSIVPNTWNYMVGTYDKTTAKLYVNGQLVQSTSATAVIRTSSQDLTIGTTKFNSSIEHETHGSIANVGIWNRALSASEIESIYWKGQYADLKGTELTNLVSWYNLKDTPSEVGGELISVANDRTFDGSTTNWSAQSGASIAVEGGELKVIFGTGVSNFANLNNTGILNGAKYQISFDIRSKSGDGDIPNVDVGHNVTYRSGINYLTVTSTETKTTHTGIITVTNATTTNRDFMVMMYLQNNKTVFVDNISIKPIQTPDSTGTNNGTVVGATTLTDAYSASSPFLPRIQDKASDTVANYGEVYGGNAVSFDGTNDYISVADSSSLDVSTNDFSVSAWFKKDTTKNQRIVDKRDTTGYTFYIDDSDLARLELNDGSGYAIYTLSSAISSGVWHHILLSADRSGNAICYLNGTLVGTVDISAKSNSLNSSSVLIIGADAPSANNLFFDGMMSGVKIFSEALTQDQVRELYTKPELTLPTGIASSALKLDMPMQEGSGTAILDGSPTTSDDFITEFVNGSSYPLDSFATNGDDITLFTESASFGGAVSNTFEVVNGNKYLIEFNYTHISGDGVRVVLTNTNTGAGTQISNNITLNSTQTVQSIFTATASSSVGRLQIGTGSGSHSVNCTISNASVKLLGLGQNHGTGDGITWATGQEYGFQHPLVRSNNPMVFDGDDDKVTISDASQIQNIWDNGGSISCWINPESDGENNGGRIFEKVQYVLQVHSESAGSMKLQFYIKFTGTDGTWNTSSTDIPINQWSHIVLTYNSSSVSNDPNIYINGSSVTLSEATTPTSAREDDSGDNLFIGTNSGGSRVFDGMINDVAIWDSALTANEVTALYNSGLPLLPTTDSGNYASRESLVGYWRNDGVTTWTDRTPTDDPELVTNGNFSGWTVESGDAFTIESDGTFTVANTSTDSTIEYSFEAVVGRTYRWNTTASSQSGTGLLYYVKQPNAGLLSFGTYRWSLTNYDFVAAATGTITLRLYKYGGHNGNGVMATASIIRERGGNNGTVAGSPASIIVPEGLNEGRDSQGYYLTDTDSISSGIRFKDSEKIVIQDSEALDFETNDFSVAFWVYFKDRVINQGIWEKRNDTSNQIRIYTDADGYINGLAKTGGSTRLHAETNSAPSINQWTYVTWVCDRNSSNFIYVNGVAQTLANNTKDDGANDMAFGEMTIGRAESSAQYLNGYLDEFKIYKSKVLSASEVLKNYNNGKSAHSN